MKLNEIQAVLEEHWPFLKLELKERQDKEDSIFLRTWSIWPCLNVKTKKQVKEIVLNLQSIRIILETINSEMDVVLRIRTQLLKQTQEGIRTIATIRKNASSGCNLIEKTLEILGNRYELKFSSLTQK